MLSSVQLANLRNIDLSTCDIESLVDLREIKIDTAKPVIDRVNSYFSQIKNPYLFKVDDVVVKVKYGNGKTFLDSLTTILTME